MNLNSKLTYLSSPYSSDNQEVMEERFRAANKAVAKLMKENQFVFSPISHCHVIAQQEKLPTDFKFWWEYNYAMIKKSDELYVLMLDGWEQSVGVKYEIEMAKILNKRICYIEKNYIE